ncbi:MAG: THUMP domain-containing protein [Candidatus Helarchaeota archaeon]
MKIFCILSGVHPDLPSEEIISILKAESLLFTIIKRLKQCLVLEIPKESHIKIINRAAYLKGIYKLLFECPLTNNSIIKAVNNTNLEMEFIDNKTFAVRIEKSRKKDIKSSFNLNTEELERFIGRLILQKYKNLLKVNLKNPDILFKGFRFGNQLLFGIELGKIATAQFQQRSGPNRPYFHPCGLDAKFARLMINLAIPKRRAIIYDPHCGIGSILIEAGFLGYKTIGSDINWKMINGSLINLNYYRIQNFEILRADSRFIPFRKVDHIITDPPYGRSSPIKGTSIINLYEKFLKQCKDIIHNNNRIVFAAPKIYSEKIESIVKNLDFELVNLFELYVHKSLIRNLWIIKLPN